jgi:hypothetical protein
MESQFEIQASLSTLALRFGWSRNGIIQALLHGLEPPEAQRRHLAVADDAEREILARIETQAEKSIGITRRDIQEHIRTFYNTVRPRTTEKMRCTPRH